MKKVLIVAATNHETRFLEKYARDPVGNKQFFSFQKKQTVFDVLTTGVGIVATAFHLTSHLQNNSYDIGINIGMAGAFDRSIKPGETVNIIEDEFADLGAEDDEKFFSVFDIGLANKNEFPFENGILKNITTGNLRCLEAIRKVSGVTINKVHGNEKSIEKFLSRYGEYRKPQTESMEGAAFFYVCTMKGISFIQIRAISNYIEKRNRNAWKIQDALKNLENVVDEMIEEISSNQSP